MAHIKATPTSMFNWGYDLSTADGHLLTMNVAWLQEGGSFAWKDKLYSLTRVSLLAGEFSLTSDGKTVASAVKESMFARRFLVHAKGHAWRLQAASPFTRAFVLLDSSQEVGSIAPNHPFTRAATIQLPSSLDVPEQVFLIWLVVILWRRAANSG